MKTNRFIVFPLVTILLCLSACSGGDAPTDSTPKPEENQPEITIESNIVTNGLTFEAKGGEKTINFRTNKEWILNVSTTTSGTTWCSTSGISSNNGNSTVTFVVAENTEYDDRSVSVTIKAGTSSVTFTITQKCADALLVTSNRFDIPQEGASIDVEVKANISYQLEISETAKSWITESKTRALTAQKHTFTVAAHEDYDKREGEIYIKSGDKVETVKIYQAGGGILLLSKNEYAVSDQGETISVDIKSNMEFGVQMPDVDWIHDQASARGSSSHTLKYVVDANETYDTRSAEIIFYDKNSDLKDTLTVVQVQKDAIIISQKEYTINSEGETIEVKLSANVEFEVTMPQVDWISKVESRALTEHILYFNIAENTNYDNRNAEIVFTNNDTQLNEKITITQLKAFLLQLTQDEFYISDASETISVELKSNVEYGIQMPEVDWITQETLGRNVSSENLKFVIAQNESYDNRSAEIVFYDKKSTLKDTLKVIQAQKDAIIISQKEFVVEEKGGILEIKLNTNVELEVQIPSNIDWITNSDSRALVEKNINLNIAENTDTISRIAEIIITNKSSEINESIIIKQAGVIPAAPITILSYLIANNNLNEDLLGNIRNMYLGLSKMNKPATLLIYWDGKSSIGNNNSTHLILKYETDGKGKINGKPALGIDARTREILDVAEVLKEYSSQVSTDKNVFQGVLSDMVSFSPTDKLGLIIGSHGSSWLNTISTSGRALGYDGSISNSIALTDIVEAIESVGQKFEFLLFDACYMGTIEVCYEVRNVTDYLIASVMELTVKGFPYEYFMEYLYETTINGYKQVCQSFINYYEDIYKNGNVAWGTIALIDCKEVDGLVNQLKQEIVAHKDVLSNFDVQDIQEYGREGGRNIAYDLKHFVKKLNEGNVPQQFIKELDEVVLYKGCLEKASYYSYNYDVDVDNFCGIGLYIPLSSYSKWNTYFKTLDWYTASGWNEVTFNWNF